jgi:hypothetical protein
VVPARSIRLDLAREPAATYGGRLSSVADTRPALVRALPVGVATVAVVYLVPAIWIVVSPRGFWHDIGPFGPYNAHYLGDVAALQAGIGLVLAAAVVRVPLRLGALLVALIATALHTLNHWLDINHAHPGSNAGASDAIQLTILTVFIAVLYRAATWKETA